MHKITIMSTCLFLLVKTASGVGSSDKNIPFNLAQTHLPGLVNPLKIVVQPVDQTDCKGNKVTFSVAAEGGAGTIHYQWERKRASDASFTTFGARDSTKLPVYNIGIGNEAPDGTLYRVTVTDETSLVISVSAILKVNQINGIAPVGVANYTVNEGTDLRFTVLTTGNSPSSFQWIKKFGNNDWRDLTDNPTVSGSRSVQLSFTKITLADSGIYKVRVTFPTMNSNQCTETSAISRTIHVIPAPDTDPPTFVNLSNGNRTFCPENLEQAMWNESQADILPDRIRFYRLHKNSTLLDLPLSCFTDNVTPAAELVLHWGIYSNSAPFDPVTDNAGNLLDNRTGQISMHPDDIDLEGLETGSRTYLAIFWLEDKAGNLTPPELRHKIVVTVSLRPEIISDF